MLTIVGVRGLIIFAPPDIPRIEQSHIDSAALVFALVLSLFCAVAFGLVPALKVTQSNPGRILQSARSGIPRSAGLSYSRNAIVIVEFALAFVLLTASGLLVRSFLAIQSVDLGFRPEHPHPDRYHSFGNDRRESNTPLRLNNSARPSLAWCSVGRRR